MNVIKRDGTVVPFDIERVKRAISKAFIESGYEHYESNVKHISDEVSQIVSDGMSVETISDIIEEILMDFDYNQVAKNFIIYREKHKLQREIQENNKYYNTILELVSGKSNDVSKENSNKDASQLYVTRDLIAGETSKRIYNKLILPKEIKDLHKKGAIHVHDCDYRLQQYITNCELTNLDDCLQNGTVINGKLIRKPHTLRTACTIASQIITAVSSCTYGGQTITLTHLAPFIRESKQRFIKRLGDCDCLIDDFVKEEITNSVQTLLFQLNTMASTNGQSPFITLFLYPNEDPEYFEETLLLCKEVLNQRIQGMESPEGQNINPTFPKLVVCLTEDMFTDSRMKEYAQLCAECVAKRMVPDFISEKNIKSLKEGCVIPPMGKHCYSPFKISLTLLRGVHKKDYLFILIIY